MDENREKGLSSRAQRHEALAWDLSEQSFDSPHANWAFTSYAAPVQAEGEVKGHPFYFRARGITWSFSAANGQEQDPVLIDNAKQGFYREGKFKTEGLNASFMPLNIARDIIQKCIEEFILESI